MLFAIVAVAATMKTTDGTNAQVSCMCAKEVRNAELLYGTCDRDTLYIATSTHFQRDTMHTFTSIYNLAYAASV